MNNKKDEWVKCILKPGKIFFQSNSTYCGCDANGFILDLEHAQGCIKMGTWIQPCEECLKLAIKDVTNE